MPFAAEKATMPSQKRARRPAVELSQEDKVNRHIRRRLDADRRAARLANREDGGTDS